jgi:hypothetical protein
MNGLPPIPEPCFDCAHFIGLRSVPDEPGVEPQTTVVCEAFPSGIPDLIQSGRHRHRSPVPGDRGKTYQRR